MLFGFLLFLPRLLTDINNRAHFLLNTLFCIAGLGLSLEIFLISGSRTAWFAFFITSIIFLPWIYFIGRDRLNLFRLREKKTLWVIVASVLVTILFFINIGTIKGRLRRPITHDVKTIQNLLNLDLKNIPFQNWDKKRVKSPIARRLILVYYGGLLLAERPWLGYGTQLDLPKLISAKFGNKKISKRNHLHNGFLIVLIRFGLVGGSIIFLAGLCLLYGLIQAYRLKKISKDLFLFLLGAILITAITGLTSFRWIHRDFRFFWLLLAGMSYTRFMFVR
jgi:O-antigen ligase